MRSSPTLADTRRYLSAYFKKGKFGAARVLVLPVVIGLVWWLVSGSSNQWLEPAVILLLLLIACLTGTQLFADISDLRAKSEALPLESIEDPTTEPWRMTNHSVHKIRWNPETTPEHLQTLGTFWKKHYARWPRGCLPRFDRLLEETATSNFRVRSLFEEVRFLRFHKAPLEGELECRRLIAEGLKEANVFPQGFADYLLSLRLKSDSFSHPIPESSFSPAGRGRGELFPYVDDDVKHFQGRASDEVASVGKLLGKLQQALQAFDDDTRESLSPLTKAPDNAFPSAKDLLHSWEYIEPLRKEGCLLHPFARLLILASEVSSWVREANEVRRSQQDEERFLLLHDVHPHNVFCKSGECVLIYDYRRIGFWPHSYVVAFALHRFVRELIVKGHSTERRRQSLITDGVRRFLDAYQESCKLPLPQDFVTNLGAYIKSSNIDSLVLAFRYGMEGHDPLRRTDARLFAEARKFIRYMKEAGKFNIG